MKKQKRRNSTENTSLCCIRIQVIEFRDQEIAMKIIIICSDGNGNAI